MRRYVAERLLEGLDLPDEAVELREVERTLAIGIVTLEHRLRLRARRLHLHQQKRDERGANEDTTTMVLRKSAEARSLGVW